MIGLKAPRAWCSPKASQIEPSQSSGGPESRMLHKIGVWHIKTIQLVRIALAWAFRAFLSSGIDQ
jgi:hypothetical protein